jgi:hypothetical protein
VTISGNYPTESIFVFHKPSVGLSKIIRSAFTPSVQCRPMCYDGPHAHAPNPHTPMLPQGSALIPNITPQPPCGQAYYPWQLSWISRLAPQINTSLFYKLCPHSCAPGNNFSVGQPSSNRFRPSTLKLEFFSDDVWKRRYTLLIWVFYQSPIKPWARMSHVTSSYITWYSLKSVKLDVDR